MTSRRVALLTGASGSVGQRLAVRLREGGWWVRALEHVRKVPTADEIVHGDIHDSRAMRRAMTDCFAVLHLAGITHARRTSQYEAVNVRGTAHLAEEARDAGVQRFLLVSSRAAGPAGGGYSRSKLESERLVADAGIPFTIVRLAEVYGANGRQGVDWIISRALRGLPIPVVGEGDEELCPVLVDDSALAIVRALDSPGALGKTYTLAGPCMSMADVARTCIRTFESESRIVRVPELVVSLAAHLSRILPLPIYPDQFSRLRAHKQHQIDEASQDLEFRPKPLSEGLKLIRRNNTSSA